MLTRSAGHEPQPNCRPESGPPPTGPAPQPAGNPEPKALDYEGGEDDASQKQNIEAHRPATGFPHDPRGVQGRWMQTLAPTPPSASEPDRHTVLPGAER